MKLFFFNRKIKNYILDVQTLTQLFIFSHINQTKSVDIQQLPALDQRSSFADASAASDSQPPAVQPLPYAGRRRRYKTKYIRNGGRDKVRYEYKYRGRYEYH